MINFKIERKSKIMTQHSKLKTALIAAKDDEQKKFKAQEDKYSTLGKRLRNQDHDSSSVRFSPPKKRSRLADSGESKKLVDRVKNFTLSDEEELKETTA